MSIESNIREVVSGHPLAEREWEEMRTALEWCADMAKEMQRATLHGDSQHMLHLMKILALDGGKKAREVL